MEIGLVGCGAWGRHILRDLVELGASVHVVARSDASVDRARAGGAASVVGDFDHLPDVAGIVVATPITTHAEVIEQCLERAVPVFTEKPLTDDPDAADRLAALAPDHLFVMDKWRYHPGIECLGRLARDGSLGRIVGVETVRVGWGNPHDDADSVWVLAPHDLSIALELLGYVPRPQAAIADVYDGYAVGLHGLLGTDPWVSIKVSTRVPVHRRSVRLLGERAVATLPDPFADAVLVHPATQPQSKDVPDPVRLALDAELPLRRELAAFLDHLKGGPPPRSSAAEGAAIVRAVADLRRLAGLPMSGDPRRP